ncbi:hypothetical protein VNO77_02266 [Canavalia gladiata]|uniref:Uncharacterized protein n=1 Tax=Canavalia gladiata TaxID=3824 RepID=A0AAN9MXM1_CANGL
MSVEPDSLGLFHGLIDFVLVYKRGNGLIWKHIWPSPVEGPPLLKEATEDRIKGQGIFGQHYASLLDRFQGHSVYALDQVWNPSLGLALQYLPWLVSSSLTDGLSKLARHDLSSVIGWVIGTQCLGPKEGRTGQYVKDNNQRKPYGKRLDQDHLLSYYPFYLQNLNSMTLILFQMSLGSAQPGNFTIFSDDDELSKAEKEDILREISVLG